MNDELGTRIKEQYENRTRYFVPRRTYTLLRLDGKAFHSYTKGLKKPFDKGLSEDIDSAIIAMLPEIQGAVFAYTQSDEISILLTDFATPQTSAWFDGNIQKMSSVAASIMTAFFNKMRMLRDFRSNGMNYEKYFTPQYSNHAFFDCRTFSVPDRTEVMNYFIWRNQDCVRNSVSMVAQNNFSHRELQNKSQKDMHEMLHQKGINWATDFTDGEKNGRIIVKEEYPREMVSVSEDMFNGSLEERMESAWKTIVMCKRWVSKGAWKFTEDKDKLLNMIPKYE